MTKHSFILLILCITGYVISAFAQDTQVELPWLPKRDTNHIRTIKVYLIDTITKTRNLNYTIHYDQHGFETDSFNSLTYDSKGRLIEFITRIKVWPYNQPEPIIKDFEKYKISYTPDGVVQRIENTYLSDSSSYTYELLTHKTHPKYGLINYTFLRTYTDKEMNTVADTVFFNREYDIQGHLTHEEWYSSDYTDNCSDITYRYDNDGRRIAKRGYYYECSDTLDYIYDAHGLLTGMKGIFYDLDMEADIIIHCRPDGTKIEAWEHLYSYEEDPDNPEKIKRSNDSAEYYCAMMIEVL